MPKKDVDYSNTIIYKICCKDESIKGMYVGHTTNFIQRKYGHKTACNNLNNALKIYNVIRCNGGWNNWNMVELAKYYCKDATEARIKEQKHYNELKASLNSCPPYVDIKQYFCDICDLQCISLKQYENHMICNKHIKNINKVEVSSNCDKILLPFCPKFYCKNCDYGTSKKSSYEYHISSDKHKRRQNGDAGDTNSAQILLSKKFTCENCNKIYLSRNGLWKHKKICIQSNCHDKSDEEDDDISTKQLVLLMLKQNNKVQDALIEMSKQISTTNNNKTTNNNNSHNNTTNNSFNLQFFLNETCKNAMNITDFANSIKLQLSDLISVGELGYVEGISNIIVKNLNALDITERPVHCTDKKRETMYIKDADKWEKDEDEKKLKKFIKNVAFKNQKLFPQFKEKYPDYNDSDSKYSDQYSKIVIESLDDNNAEKEEKIIKKISKAVNIKSGKY